MMAATDRLTFTCSCTVCKGLTFTAPAGYVSGTHAQVRAMVHNYAQGAHAVAGIGRIMADRAGIVAVTR
jgi:hypothetical protein